MNYLIRIYAVWYNITEEKTFFKPRRGEVDTSMFRIPLQVSQSSDPIMEGIECRNFIMNCVAGLPTPAG